MEWLSWKQRQARVIMKEGMKGFGGERRGHDTKICSKTRLRVWVSIPFTVHTAPSMNYTQNSNVCGNGDWINVRMLTSTEHDRLTATFLPAISLQQWIRSPVVIVAGLRPPRTPLRSPPSFM